MDEDVNQQAAFSPPDEKAPAKFSFTFAKSSTSSRPPLLSKSDRRLNEPDGREFVSEFDGKGRNHEASIKIIPLPEKSWRPEKRMKNIMIASESLTSTEERFETQTLPAGPQPSVQYGLQLREQSEETQQTSEAVTESVQDRDVQRLQEDLALLPEEATLDAYEDVPVEEFGKALLRGMGWENGKPIGRNSTVVAVPIEASRRVGREGLGAIPAPKPEKVKKYIKPGESRKVTHTVGRVMCVIAGIHAGSRGQIAEVNGSSYTVALFESGERVHVTEDELAEVGSSEEEKARKKLSRPQTERENGHKKDFHEHVHSPDDDGRKRNGPSDEEVRRGGRLSSEDMDVQHRRKSGERHKKDEMSGRAREELKHASTCESSKETHRRAIRDESRGYDKRGSSDAVDKRQEKYINRREEGKGLKDQRENYESTSTEKRDSLGKDLSDDKYRGKDGGNRRSDAKAGSSKDYQENSRSFKIDSKPKMVSLKGSSIRPASDSADYGSGRLQSWLARDIRVRIIEKRAYGDRLYLQKARVVDVVSPLVCDIQMDESGKIIQEVKQEHLETALPKRGGRVLLVGGKYRGQVGNLQERDSDRGVGLVRLEESYELVSISLDDLAEFVGALHEMEQ